MTVRTSFFFCIHAAHLLLAAIIAIFITFHLSPRQASAATKLWGGGNNDWSKASSWLPAGIPNNGDTVTINISNGCTVTYDSLIAESDLFSFTVSSQPGALADTLSMPFNNILKTSDREYIGGYVGSPAGGNTGTFNQSNGTNNVGFSVGASLILGYNAPDNGFYNLSGGTLTTQAAAQIGLNGTGVFTQSGGSNTINSALNVANNLNSNGTYILNDGALLVGTIESIGFVGTGTFTQSGGSNTVLQTLNIGAGPGSNGTFTLSGGTVSCGANSLGGSLYVGGAALASGGPGVLNVSDTGDLTTPAAIVVYNVGTNAINLSGGTIHTAALNLNGSPARLNWTGGTLNFTTSVTFDSFAAGNSTSAAFGASLDLASSETLAITGDEVLGGSGPFTLTIEAGGAHAVSGNIYLSSTGTLNLVAGHSLAYSTFTQAGGTIIGDLINNASFSYSSGAFTDRFINNGIVDFGSITAGNGIQNNASFSVNPGQFISADGAGLDNQGSIAFAGGTLAGAGPLVNNNLITGNGTIDGTAGFTNNASLTPTGTLVLANTGPNANADAATIHLSFGNRLQIAPGASLSNAGFIDLNSGAITGDGSLTNAPGGIIASPGTISSAFDNAGLLTVNAGILTTPSFTNTGIIELASASGKIAAGSTITNNDTIEGRGQISADVVNNATLEAVGGSLIVAGSLTNAPTGSLRATLGNKLLFTGAFPANAGIITLAGGTFDTNAQPLTNNGSIIGFGLLSTGGFTNNNIMTLTGGTTTVNGPVTNSAGKTINIKFQPAIFTGNVTNNGTIKTTSTTVTFTGNYTGNAYISDPSTNIFQQNAVVIPGGLMTGSTGDAFLFNTFTNNGTFTNGGNLSVSTSITNTASFTQSGPQSWSPGATFTNSSGAAKFQSNAKLYGLTINAGTVDITSSKFIIEAVTNKAATLSSLQNKIASHSLTSSTLPANFGLALVDNALLNKPTFGGQPADINSLLLSPELLGDANIDGHVDLTDLSTILNHFGATTPNWTDGNFDHAPAIDLTDLSDVLNNFGQSNPNASATSQLPITNDQLPTPTPEPATLTLLTLALLFPRRQRSS